MSRCSLLDFDPELASKPLKYSAAVGVHGWSGERFWRCACGTKLNEVGKVGWHVSSNPDVHLAWIDLAAPCSTCVLAELGAYAYRFSEPACTRWCRSDHRRAHWL